jgi:hypothetical protein
VDGRWSSAPPGRGVTLDSPERQEFSGKTLEDALIWGLVWLMATVIGHRRGFDWGHAIGAGPNRVRGG